MGWDYTDGLYATVSCTLYRNLPCRYVDDMALIVEVEEDCLAHKVSGMRGEVCVHMGGCIFKLGW